MSFKFVTDSLVKMPIPIPLGSNKIFQPNLVTKDLHQYVILGDLYSFEFKIPGEVKTNKSLNLFFPINKKLYRSDVIDIIVTCQK